MKTPKTATKRTQHQATAKRPPRALTVRQQQFCELVASGMGQTVAWLKVYPGVSYQTAGANACESLKNPRISTRIAQLRAPQTKKLMLSKDRKREILHTIAESERAGLLVRIRAIEVDAKLAGHFEAERVEVETGPKTLDEVRARANAVASGLDLIARRAVRAQEEAGANGSNGSNGKNNGNGSNGNGNGNGHHPPARGLSRWNRS